MFARRILKNSSSLSTSNTLLRAFTSSSTSFKRSPALSDITPEGVSSFDAKQKEFRERLADQSKKKEAAASQSAEPSPSFNSSPTAPRASNARSSTSNNHTTHAIDSQSVSAAEETTPEDESAKGKLSSLIYGTKEGRDMDKEMEHSFSQVLARGKYVHSIVFHEVKPDKVDEYVELVGSWYPRMAGMPENKVHLVGSWRTEVGDCDTFVHIWEYQRYDGYHDSLHSISNHPEFPAFDKKLKSLIKTKRNSLMQEFSFWPTTAPRQLGGVFELRSYTLHPGNLLEWETHWRRGLGARRQVMEGVGAWFVQIGELNTVHHLWQFADLEERKVRREQSWSVEGWGDTVHKTVPLIQEMKSRILIPMPWSPVA
ncbi:Protein NipSnap-like protein [Lachnellula subtilissima]|uniref:Protein NipSnap-like protein n=1 Tax=Lachnellula subtilissima TaxID=602034 RepID=A0A8H8U9N2_9HELO|nr:Protein NipSnap-like protein [Lachnellula subtilissima]